MKSLVIIFKIISFSIMNTEYDIEQYSRVQYLEIFYFTAINTH